MYTMIERRTVNPATIAETGERANLEYFPKLQSAPGFIGFYVVSDEARGINTAIEVWQTRADAESFDTTRGAWLRTLEDLGHQFQAENSGETVIQIKPNK